MTVNEFKSVKETLKNVVEPCQNQLAGITVGLMGPSGASVNVSWVNDEWAFLTLLKSMNISDLQVNKIPSNGQFASLIQQAIEATKNDLDPDPDPNSSFHVREILIISDWDLALDQHDADSIVNQQLATNHIHMRYLWVPTGNETFPWNMYTNNIDNIIDPTRTPTYLNDSSQLSQDDTIKQLAICLFPQSTFMIRKNQPSQPQPPPQPPPQFPPPPQQQPQPEPYYSMPKPPPPPGNASWGQSLSITHTLYECETTVSSYKISKNDF
jgi:hypothetical protein